MLQPSPSANHVKARLSSNYLTSERMKLKIYVRLLFSPWRVLIINLTL